jgi:hypothetical protein
MGGESIANIIVKVLLDAIDAVAEALVRFAQFLDQMVKTIGPLIGIDLRSSVQKAIDEIEARIEAMRPRTEFEGFGILENDLRELARLQAKLAEEAAREAGKSSYESIIETIKTATEEARKRLGDSAADDILNSSSSINDEGIIRELKELNRNSRTRTVEIMG